MIQTQEHLINRADQDTLRLYMQHMKALVPILGMVAECSKSEYIATALDRLQSIEREVAKMPDKPRLTLVEIIKGARARLVNRGCGLILKYVNIKLANEMLNKMQRRVSEPELIGIIEAARSQVIVNIADLASKQPSEKCQNALLEPNMEVLTNPKHLSVLSNVKSQRILIKMFRSKVMPC